MRTQVLKVVIKVDVADRDRRAVALGVPVHAAALEPLKVVGLADLGTRELVCACVCACMCFQRSARQQQHFACVSLNRWVTCAQHMKTRAAAAAAAGHA